MQDDKTRLQNQKTELLAELESLEQTAKPVVLDQQAFGRVSRGDALQQQNMALANLQLVKTRLQQTERALQKIATDDYGYCEACGDEINPARLMARPESLYCIACQEKVEQ